MNLRYELQNVISGVGKSAAKNLIEAAASFLRESKKASGSIETIKFSKDEEDAQLISWIEQNNLWQKAPDEERYLSRGAEQRVYLDNDGLSVVKLNDIIFYENWTDYFHSLLIHNFLFPETAYELIGFYTENSVVHAVVKQAFVQITETTNPESVKNFLLENGFTLKKNNDYFHEGAGIIIEDLHDENVLTNNGVLFFIDTVIYLTPDFF